MRTQSIIAQFPRLRVAVLGSALSTCAVLSHAGPALAAPAKAGAPAKAAPAGAAAAAPGAPDAATKKAAREAYGAGEKAFSGQDYKTAFAEFKKAHDLIPTIHAEYWMAMAQSYDADVAAAYDALAAVVTSPDAQKLGEEKLGLATGRLAELKKAPATIAFASVPSGAEVSVDGAPQPGLTPNTVSMPAGTHHIALGLRGFEVYQTDLTVKPGQKLEQHVDLKEAAPAPVAAATAPAPKKAEPPPAPPPVKEEKSNLPAYITLGVGVVGAGVGTVFGIQALNAKKDFDNQPTSDNADKAERNALIADMGFAVALTLGITGIVLLATDDSSEIAAHDTTAPRTIRAKLDLAPVISQTTQGAAARLTF